MDIKPIETFYAGIYLARYGQSVEVQVYRDRAAWLKRKEQAA